MIFFMVQLSEDQLSKIEENRKNALKKLEERRRDASQPLSSTTQTQTVFPLQKSPYFPNTLGPGASVQMEVSACQHQSTPHTKESSEANANHCTPVIPSPPSRKYFTGHIHFELHSKDTFSVTDAHSLAPIFKSLPGYKYGKIYPFMLCIF